MNLVKYDNAKDFANASMYWLGQDEGVNAVAIGVLQNLLSDNPRYDEAFYAGVFDKSKIIGTALMTPPYPLNINGTSTDVVDELIVFAQSISRPSSVLGPGEFAKVFAEKWCKQTGCKIADKEAQAIHRADSINHPSTSVGTYCIANNEHRDVLVEWSNAFCIDCDMPETIPDVLKFVEGRINEQNFFLLLVDGEPVCMAAKARESVNGGTIGWVYTPPKYRKRGYASELVAKLGQDILDSGKKHLFLYTQLENPTSNKIYYDLGFRVISDSWQIKFAY